MTHLKPSPRRAVPVLLGVGLLWGAVSQRPQAEPPLAEEGTTLHRASERSQPAAAAAAPSRADAPSAAEDGPWRSDQVMVLVSASEDPDALAHRHGSRVVRPAGPSGLVALAVPPDRSAAELLSVLRADPGVIRANSVGVTRGAGTYDDPAKRSSVHQWHLIAGRAPLAAQRDVSRYVVAVLDTGVAYEDYAHGNRRYVQAPTLAGASIVEPWDFVNGDEHANDDHQHGTHIASLIASEGAMEGVAAGVSLMPLKVLDEHNQGTELDLVDAIYHAVDNGADVINMSLSFSPGYIPSAELLAAIDYAAQAGVVMVAAAGNDGLRQVTWPAASPAVVAVAASRPGKWDNQQIGGWDRKSTYLADYANRGLKVDICAPGGALDFDRTRDSTRDGIVAETIDPADPSRTGYWAYAGSSQAAAQVSGGVVHLLALGASPEQVPLALQYGALTDGYPSDRWRDGSGAGGMNLENSLAAVADQKSEISPDNGYNVALLPHLRERDTTDNKTGAVEKTEVRAQALVTAVDDSGNLIASGTVWATIWTNTGLQETATCVLAGGRCTLGGSWYDLLSPTAPSAFVVEISGIHDGHVMHRPGKALFATEGGSILLQAVQDSPALLDATLAIHLKGGVDPVLSKIADSYAVLDLGTGLSSSPLGIVFRPSALDVASTLESVSVDLDGTGLSSSPLGTASVRLVKLDGTGLSSSPLGFTTLRLAAIDGTGLSSSPLGFHVSHLLSYTAGTGLSSSPLGLSGNAVLLGRGTVSGSGIAGLGGFEALIAGEGHLTPDGYEAASFLAATGAVDVGLSVESLGGSSAPNGAMTLAGARL